MKIFVLQYTLVADVDSESDCPSDVNMETMASPQFACVSTEEGLDAAIAKVKQEVEKEHREIYDGDDMEDMDFEYEWTEHDWNRPTEGRPNRSLFFLEDGDEVAQIVIQEVEALTG